MKRIHQRILDLNHTKSAEFVDAEPARRRYRARHPTHLAAVKCMDGRVLFPTLTQTPIGLVRPFRAIGGRPEVFWPSFLGRVRASVEEAMAVGVRNVLFLTYHFSESDPHLGCAGWSYDAVAARRHAEKLARDLRYVFGDQLVAIVAGVETDRDVLTLHGPGGDASGAALVGASDDEIRASLVRALPDVDAVTVDDLVPLLRGNASRVASLIAAPRSLDAKSHAERVLALGQGFDWLHEANFALIVNDADPGLARSIEIAASILAANLERDEEGDEATLFTCVPYDEPGIDHRQAIARSRGLCDFALEVVRAKCPALLAGQRFHALAAVVWAPARRLEVIEAT